MLRHALSARQVGALITSLTGGKIVAPAEFAAAAARKTDHAEAPAAKRYKKGQEDKRCESHDASLHACMHA